MSSSNKDAIRRITARGGMISVIAEILRFAIHFVVLAVLARLLKPEDFGLFAMAAVVTALANLFTEFGLSTATIQRRSVSPSLTSGLFYISVGLSILVAGCLLMLGPTAAILFEEPQVATLISVLAMTLPVVAAGRQHAALLRREMRWELSEAIRIGAQLAGSAAAILAAVVWDLGVWCLVLHALFAAAVEMVALWWAMPWRPGRVSDWKEVKSATIFGVNLAFFSLLNFLHRQGDDAMIGWRWGPLDLGMYSRAYAIFSAPIQIFRGPLSSVIVPTLSRLQDDDRAWADLYRNTLTAALIIVTPACFLAIILSEPIILLLLGDGWEEAIAIFRLLSISLIAQLIMSSTGWLWISKGQSREMMIWAMISIPLMLLAMLAGLQYGPRGVAFGYAISFCLLTPACSWMAARSLPITFGEILRAAIRPLTAGLLAFALSFMAASVWTASALFLMLYTIAIAVVDMNSLKGMVLLARSTFRGSDTIEER